MDTPQNNNLASLQMAMFKASKPTFAQVTNTSYEIPEGAQVVRIKAEEDSYIDMSSSDAVDPTGLDSTDSMLLNEGETEYFGVVPGTLLYVNGSVNVSIW